MRPSGTVARAALTAVLALGALPGLVGSHEPSQDRPIDAALFGPVNLATTRDRQAIGLILPDADGQSAGALNLLDSFVELDSSEPLAPDDRAQPALRAVSAGWSWKDPRYSLHGIASFYDNGTTAMRDVPRGTTIVICGAGGCIERVVTDYGPSKAGGRLIDMYRPDFFAICGCGWWSGTTSVTVKVY
ncbi:MAG TPA: hypothetical protein VJ850_06850 [Candidatus Limnocylindrales bacterium]|nr:hypothetical protein [Candidatus Limnocylindrales bacterium]